MTWNYRVCKSVYKDDGYEEVNYEIHEVYYNPDGSIWAITQNAVSVHSETLHGIEDVLSMMKVALEKDVIDLDTIVYAPQQPKEPTLEEMLDAFDPEKHGGEIMAGPPIGNENL